MTTEITPRIYVACLAAYNSGILHGEWIYANQSADEIQAEVEAMLKDSPAPDAEEWAIHDHEGFLGMPISESTSFEDVAALAELIEKHGQAYADYVSNVGAHYATVEDFQESYQGEFANERAFAESILDDCYEAASWPEPARNYFDYDAFARDLFMGDYTISANGHVFRSC